MPRPAGLLVVAEGEGAELPGGQAHLAAQVATRVAGHDRLEVRVRSEIPVARGLGSSAAIAVAAAAAAGAIDPFEAGFVVDGHPENAAASALGRPGCGGGGRGAPGRPARCASTLSCASSLSCPTGDCRRRPPGTSCRPTVPHEDAAFNLSRLGLLIAGLADHSQLLATSGDDRLHQGPRSALFPEAPALLDGFATSRRPDLMLVGCRAEPARDLCRCRS